MNWTKIRFVYPSQTWIHSGLITGRKRSCGKVVFLHLSVSHSFHGGGSASSAVCIQGVCIRGHLHPGVVCIQWGWADPPLRYYVIQSTSGLYASYWNAFLFLYASVLRNPSGALQWVVGILNTKLNWISINSSSWKIQLHWVVLKQKLIHKKIKV